MVYKGVNYLRRRELPVAWMVPTEAGGTSLAGWAPCKEGIKVSDHQIVFQP